MFNTPSFPKHLLLTQAKNMCKVDNALLIFKTTSSGKSQKYCDEVYAYLLNKKNIMESKTAYVSDISGTLYMYYKNEK